MTTIATLDAPGVSAETLPQSDGDVRPARAFVYHQVMAMPGDDDANSRAASAYDEGREYWQRCLEPMGVDLYDGERLVDVTAEPRYVLFCDRPMGRKLSGEARPGDHVIFTRCPCTPVEMKDFVRMISIWTARSVSLHVAELQIAMASETGRVVARAMQLIVAGQRDRKSWQNRLIAEKSRALGRPTNGIKRVGFKVEIGPDGNNYVVPDLEYRAILNEVQRLREMEGKSWRQVSDEIARALSKGIDRAIPYWRKQWSRQRCCNRYHKWLQIQEEERAAGLAEQGGR